MKQQKAIIFDDHQLFSDSFSSILEKAEIFASVHSFSDEKLLIRFLMLESPNPIVLFLDFLLIKGNSLHLINETRRLNRNLNVIIVSGITSPSLIKSILSYHPQGFISKFSGFDKIVECLNKNAEGNQFICPEIKKILRSTDKMDEIHFTSRELQLLQYFAQGNSIVKTAELVHLSKHTIVSHRRKMMKKANCNSITELLAFARLHGLI
ncbi:response regulator transcription factor [Algoriphagus sp. NG3]|uniref:response regulator transcription factor n=1 Tax=Algoriphagus sp. NG3 TaxID=3097546 RepID=UPI002A8178F1|nr:response regulator transcription factor [Algoriphagus sp. NG3]WPR77764.1 response regulator transcription factor [Algoriphagus sp. NG3]